MRAVFRDDPAGFVAAHLPDAGWQARGMPRLLFWPSAFLGSGWATFPADHAPDATRDMPASPVAYGADIAAAAASEANRTGRDRAGDRAAGDVSGCLPPARRPGALDAHPIARRRAALRAGIGRTARPQHRDRLASPQRPEAARPRRYSARRAPPLLPSPHRPPARPARGRGAAVAYSNDSFSVWEGENARDAGGHGAVAGASGAEHRAGGGVPAQFVRDAGALALGGATDALLAGHPECRLRHDDCEGRAARRADRLALLPRAASISRPSRQRRGRGW